MKKFLLKTKRQIQTGEILSGIGLAVYIAGVALKLPALLLIGVLILFSFISLWTFLSLVLRPKSERETDLTPSLGMGQAALTILLIACLVLAIRKFAGL
jgi:ABC-type enterochelin transport system permease subunit